MINRRVYCCSILANGEIGNGSLGSIVDQLIVRVVMREI